MLLGGADRQDRQFRAARFQFRGCVAGVQNTATLPAGRYAAALTFIYVDAFNLYYGALKGTS